MAFGTEHEGTWHCRAGHREHSHAISSLAQWRCCWQPPRKNAKHTLSRNRTWLAWGVLGEAELFREYSLQFLQPQARLVSVTACPLPCSCGAICGPHRVETCLCSTLSRSPRIRACPILPAQGLCLLHPPCCPFPKNHTLASPWSRARKAQEQGLAQGASAQCSQEHGGIAGVSYAGPGVGLDPCGSLPAGNIPRFYSHSKVAVWDQGGSRSAAEATFPWGWGAVGKPARCRQHVGSRMRATIASPAGQGPQAGGRGQRERRGRAGPSAAPMAAPPQLRRAVAPPGGDRGRHLPPGLGGASR